MYIINKLILTVFLLHLYSHAFTQGKISPTKVIIKLIPVFNNQKLIINENEYVTHQNDTIKIAVFKMYVSNVTLKSNVKLESINLPNYFLVDAEDTSTLNLSLSNILPSTYHQLQLLIGIDSLTNVSGALDGDLDPIKGMFWAWNTGYISAKMEGNFKNGNISKNKFEFHIGGYQKPYESSRKIILNFPDIKVVANETLEIECYVDLAEWFNGNTTIQLTQLNTVVHPCKTSSQLADNYSKMIKYKSSKILK